MTPDRHKEVIDSLSEITSAKKDFSPKFVQAMNVKAIIGGTVSQRQAQRLKVVATAIKETTPLFVETKKLAVQFLKEKTE